MYDLSSSLCVVHVLLHSYIGQSSNRYNYDITVKPDFAFLCLEQALETDQGHRSHPELVDKAKQLEQEVSYYKEESHKAQAEVERLLEILREVETEKTDKDKKITDLER